MGVDAHVPQQFPVGTKSAGKLPSNGLGIFTEQFPASLYYLAAEDVRWDLLEPSARRTGCPYKGQAVYWSARIGDRFLDDLAWSYLDPIPEMPRIRGRIAFWRGVRVDP